MGAISVILAPFLLFWSYCLFFIFSLNLDGILSCFFANKHKIIFVRLNGFFLILSLLCLITGFFGLLPESRTFNIIILLFIPVELLNIFAFRFFHNKGVDFIRFRNVIGCLVGILPFMLSFVLLFHSEIGYFYLAKDELRDSMKYRGVYRLNLIDYIYDDGSHSDKVFDDFLERLKKDDSDVNRKVQVSQNGEEYDTYLINSICVDENGYHSPYRYEMLKLLIEHGADVNVQDSYGCSPLMYLCRRRAVMEHDGSEISEDIYECCELLLEKGADISLKDQDGETVISQIDHELEMLKESLETAHHASMYGDRKKEQINADKMDEKYQDTLKRIRKIMVSEKLSQD